jgi:hypothetical protein
MRTTHRSVGIHEQPDRICGENSPESIIVGEVMSSSGCLLTENTKHHPARGDEGDLRRG